MINVQCFICKYYTGELTCKAFPERIPEEILQGFNHEEEFPGDKGIRFGKFDPKDVEIIEIEGNVDYDPENENWIAKLRNGNSNKD